MSTLSTVIGRGTRAVQPAATAVPIGAIYTVTDEGNVQERSTGAAWQSFCPLGTRTIVKASDEGGITNNTLQNDDELLMTVVANAVYVVEVVLFVTTGASSTPDFQVAFTMPTAATYSGIIDALTAAATLSTDDNLGFRYRESSPTTAQSAGVVGSANGGCFIKGVLKTGANAGTFQLQWAQNTTNATATVVKADSYLSLTRVS